MLSCIKELIMHDVLSSFLNRGPPLWILNEYRRLEEFDRLDQIHNAGHDFVLELLGNRVFLLLIVKKKNLIEILSSHFAGRFLLLEL